MAEENLAMRLIPYQQRICYSPRWLRVPEPNVEAMKPDEEAKKLLQERSSSSVLEAREQAKVVGEEETIWNSLSETKQDKSTTCQGRDRDSEVDVETEEDLPSDEKGESLDDDGAKTVEAIEKV
ncbi:hypothetical protein HPP92_018816 [Vanilla planifolia]|uniref:Uncharacterized protein n=1 Tax=Vanilla planifolia TaxID=51239 RepID=A0A835QBB5_VANPL|nr:hypothetical protein HPP92_018816 [Vanilla planifolia]